VLPNCFSLANRIALVTGGATGIGQAIAVALAQAGASVAITVHASPAEQTRTLIEATDQKYFEVSADLSNSADVTALIKSVEAEFGAIDILVNNAGIIRRSPAEDYQDEDWAAVLDVNLTAAWRLAQAAGKGMLERGHGKIVNIASLLSFQGGIRVPAYTAAKHALVGMTKALANEWAARGVNVNAVAPGYIETANTEALRQDEIRSRQILERIPAGRWGQPEDIAGAVVFLASSASDYVHGHVLVVDGGWLGR
jgi:2-deoxy-D-gluconate 3-dehydrogenase